MAEEGYWMVLEIGTSSRHEYPVPTDIQALTSSCLAHLRNLFCGVSTGVTRLSSSIGGLFRGAAMDAASSDDTMMKDISLPVMRV